MSEDSEELYDHCPACGTRIGLAERVNGQPVDAPADRWTCPSCKKDFCINCYGRDNIVTELKHECAPLTGDFEARFGVGASSEAQNEKV